MYSRNKAVVDVVPGAIELELLHVVFLVTVTHRQPGRHVVFRQKIIIVGKRIDSLAATVCMVNVCSCVFRAAKSDGIVQLAAVNCRGRAMCIKFERPRFIDIPRKVEAIRFVLVLQGLPD